MDPSILKHSASCGRFEIFQVFFIQLPRFVSIWGIFLMFFGNYNPGWRCVSFQEKGVTSFKNSHIDINGTKVMYGNINPIHFPAESRVGRHNNFAEFAYVEFNDTANIARSESSSLNSSRPVHEYYENAKTIDEQSKNYVYNGTCDVMKTCRKIQFNPESSTIITEFGLVCDRDWIPSVILTVVNAGFFIGSFVSGQVSERFGRKAGLYGSTLILAISSGAAVFSPNWETFTIFTFFIGAGGFGIISASVVFTLEFLNSNWRGYMSSRPVAMLSLCVLSIAISLLKSWKYLHAVTCVASCLSLIGYFVVLESPRWLFVNSYYEKGYEIVQKIARRNQKPFKDSQNEFREVIEKLNQEQVSISYSYVDILRSKKHIITTVKFSILMIFELFIYHAFIFGVKSIPGDFYTNAIISSFIQAAIVLSAGPISNFTGRRTSGFIYSVLGAILCVLIVASVFFAEGYIQSTIIKISAYLAKAASQATISVSLLFAAETFPTAIRSVGVSFVNGIACLGGLIAPYVIPKNDDDVSFAVCFSVMALSFLMNGAIFYVLPETKNEQLKDDLSSNEKQNVNSSCPC